MTKFLFPVFDPLHQYLTFQSRTVHATHSGTPMQSAMPYFVSKSHVDQVVYFGTVKVFQIHGRNVEDFQQIFFDVTSFVGNQISLHRLVSVVQILYIYLEKFLTLGIFKTGWGELQTMNSPAYILYLTDLLSIQLCILQRGRVHVVGKSSIDVCSTQFSTDEVRDKKAFHVNHHGDSLQDIEFVICCARHLYERDDKSKPPAT